MSYITPLPGIITSSGSSIPSGYVGETITGSILYANRVSLTASNVTTQILTISVTAGYYEVTGFIGVTNIDNVALTAGINTSPTINSTPADQVQILRSSSGTSSISGIAIDGKYLIFATTTTLYLIATCVYTGGPPQCWGSITATRLL
jgi:hypothetical protein